MGSTVDIYLQRADNEILAAQSLKRLSEHPEDKTRFNLPAETTFYSGVISHAYYAIFYSAKALLLTKNIKTSAPEVHRKTFEQFKNKCVDTGILDVKLLTIYSRMIVRADDLLKIFMVEKKKRGRYTYETIPQANKAPADDSLKNARFFVSHVMKTVKAH